jgi:hypothetical protein
MNFGKQPFVPPVPLSYRVGTTGSRRLPDGSKPVLRQRVAAVLELIARTLHDLAPEAAEFYAADATGTVQPRLRVLSPLAEGSDRMVAEAALELGYALESPLPFSVAEYEADFPATVAEFRALYARATHRLELDGARGEAEGGSYEAVGRHVARNADLIVAVWDGQNALGRGGAGDIVRYAVRTGVPVWWLPTNGGEPRLLSTPSDLRALAAAPAGKAAEQSLGALLRRAVFPPARAPSHPHTVIGRVVHRATSLLPESTPLQDYLREDGRPSARIWRMHGWFVDLVAPRPPSRPAVAGVAPRGVVETYWHGFYAAADTLSQNYADRYRSSYLLVFVLAFVAVINAVAAADIELVALGTTWVELVVLLGIAVLVGINHLLRWHERWISYRLLSELCRNQLMLATVGWSLPNWEAEHLTAEPDSSVGEPGLEWDPWVAWYFTAARRAAPLPEGAFTPCVLARARESARDLLQEQEAYHHAHQIRDTAAAHRLASLGEWFFIAALVGVATKLLLLGAGHGGVDHLLEPLFFLLPAASAAFVGVRSYAEFEPLAYQSARMRATMRAGLADLDALQLDRPLASAALGGVLTAIVSSMLQDTTGWAQLFRMKTVETG